MSTTALQTRPSAIHTWWTILRISLEERLVYRGDFMLGTLMRFLPVVTQVFLWTAVFDAVSQSSAVGQASGAEQTSIAGFTRDGFIAYYLLSMVARAFSSMPLLASGIARSIRDGSVKKYLIQPVDMIGFLFIGRIAHKLVYYLVATIPFALVFYLFRGYFSGWPEPTVILAFVWSCMMSFVLGFFLDAAIGMLGFWFLEISSLLFVYMLFNYILSGMMFPISLLDRFTMFGSVSWGDAVRALPFQYLAYFPAAVFLGKITGAALIRGLILQLAWTVFFVILCRLAYNRGLRNYSAFGG